MREFFVFGAFVLVLGGSQVAHARDSRCEGACVKPPEATVAAAPGAEVVPVESTTWCGKRSDKVDGLDLDAGVSRLGREVEQALFKGWLEEREAYTIAEVSCQRSDEKGDDANLAKHVASWRQAMVNLMGMTVAENAAYMSLLALGDDKVTKLTRALCDKLADTKAGSGEDSMRLAARRFVLGCNLDTSDDSDGGNRRDRDDDDGISGDDDAAWSMARRQEKLPGQLVTLVHVAKCLGAQPRLPEKRSVVDSGFAADFVACAHDIKTLDKAALVAELKKLDPIEQIRALQAFGMVKRYVAFVTSSFAGAAKKHPELVTILDKAPERGFADWVAKAAPWKAQLEAATTYEAKFYAARTSKSAIQKAFAGCGAPLRKAFQDFVHARKPKTAAQVRAVGRDPIGVALGLALSACDAAEGRGFAGEALWDLMFTDNGEKAQSANHFSIAGPRAASFTAAERVLAEIDKDQSNFPLKLDMFHSDRGVASGASSDFAQDVFKRLQLDEKRGYDGGEDGTWSDVVKASSGREPGDSDGEILRVTKGQGGVVASFKTVSWMEGMQTCVDAKPRRVDYVEHENGRSTVVYVQSCTPAGSEKRTSTLAPIVLPEAIATGLRPGLFVRVRAPYSDIWRGKGARPGFIVEGYADKARKKLVYAIGMPL